MAEAALGRARAMSSSSTMPAVCVVHAFGQAIADWQRVHPQLTAHVVFEQGAAAGSPAGRPTLDQLRGWVPADAEVYVLGPKPFMGFVDRTVAEIGVPEQRRHHEFFGPAEALA
jgi:nitric oxide dioxygenase